MTEKQSRIGYSVVENQASNKDLCFSRSKCNKIGAADAIISKNATNSRKNLTPSRKRTNKVPPNIFRDL